jgi:hypothetical protein
LPVELKFTEEVNRGGKPGGKGKKKGKKKKKGGKKKKKKGGDEEKEKEEPKLYNDEKFGLMKSLFLQYHDMSYDVEPEEEIVLEKNAIALDINQAIRII